MALRLELARHLADFDGVSVLVTHDALDAMTVANRVLVLDDGRVAQDGTPAEVARQPATDHVARLVGLNVLRGTSSGTVDPAGRRHDAGLDHAGPRRGQRLLQPRRRSRSRSGSRTARPATAGAGRVTSVAPHGSAVRVHVDAAGGLIADVTPASAGQLGAGARAPRCGRRSRRPRSRSTAA